MSLLGLGLALWGLGSVLSDRGDAAAFAQVPASRPAGQGVVISSTPVGEGEVMIALLDTAQQRLAVYLADGKRGRLRLLAVRDISADWALVDYNNDPPLPKDVRARVEKLMESGRPAGGESRKPEGSP